MLGVISTHEPIRGEFAKTVRKMLDDSSSVKRTTVTNKQSKWIVKEEI